MITEIRHLYSAYLEADSSHLENGRSRRIFSRGLSKPLSVILPYIGEGEAPKHVNLVALYESKMANKLFLEALRDVLGADLV